VEFNGVKNFQILVCLVFYGHYKFNQKGKKHLIELVIF
jgi:hypothetical protein